MSNYPPGAENDPRAPYNREPPLMETKAMGVTIDVTIEVQENVDADHELREIRRAIEAGDYQILAHETDEVLDRGRP